MSDVDFDAITIGGGFYGCMIALHLARQYSLRRILLLESEPALLSRASYKNQARIHNGYHYPRSFTTAYRSRINAPRFIQDWPEAIQSNFIHLYAIARHQSKVTSRQFIRFCKEIGARIQPAEARWRALFEPRLIEDVFVVEEKAFDSKKLAFLIEKELTQLGIQVYKERRVTRIVRGEKGSLHTFVCLQNGKEERFSSRYLFNCTYSGLNQYGLSDTCMKLKQEIVEMPLLKMPLPLAEVGITVMDGPFFSLLPFPPRGLHTLHHVRYTPHLCWEDRHDTDPYQKLRDYANTTRVDRMMRDAGRYLPSLFDAKYVDSFFEIKTLLVKNEEDDGRPILFVEHAELPGCYSVLGGKIDNIYDVLEKLDYEFLKYK